MGPCPETDFRAFECAVLNVALDRTQPAREQVPLFVRRLKTPSGGARTAVVALSGGPGQAAAPSAAEFAVALAPALRERDLLVFDQRGTGRSAPLTCDALRRGGRPTEVVQACAGQIGPRRAFFRTEDSVQDLEDLRREGGYDKLTLFGVSYGTKVALDYAARYPSRVERLVLDSIVPQEGPDPLVRSTILALRRVLRELCAAGRCRRATPDPVGDVARLVARGDRVRGTYVDARGRRRRAAMDGSALFSIFQAGDLNPAWRAQLPAAMRAAVRGDEAALLRLASTVLGSSGSTARFAAPPAATASGATGADRFQVQSSGSNQALFLATICEEVRFPWDRAASLQARVQQADTALRDLPPESLSPFDRGSVATLGLLPLCIGWPNATVAPGVGGTLPQVPALLLSGTADIRTPTEDAGAVASRLGPGAVTLPVPFVGHSVLGGDPSGCSRAAIAGFFNGNVVTPCENRGPIVDPAARSPRTLGALPRTGGLPGRAGRTLTAVLRTRDDALLQGLGLALDEARRSGGLRGGVIVRSDAGITLRNASVIDGVRVSGTFPEQRGTARLRVTGPAAARGTLTFTRTGRVSGTLGGVRVRLSRARAASAPGALPWNVTAEAKRLRRLDLGG